MFTYSLQDLLALSPSQRRYAVPATRVQTDAIYGEPWKRYGAADRPLTSYSLPNVKPFPSPRLPTAREVAERAMQEAFIRIRERRKVTKKGRFLERMKEQLQIGNAEARAEAEKRGYQKHPRLVA